MIVAMRPSNEKAAMVARDPFDVVFMCGGIAA
jgi:hypothetical protein